METLDRDFRPVLPDVEPSGSFIINEDVPGADFREPNGLAYLPCRVDVYREEQPESVKYTALLNHAPINGLELQKLLLAIAPNKGFGGSLRGVIADWDVVEKAQNNSYGLANTDSNPNHRLVALHEYLGQSWTDFMVSRPAFLEAFIDVEEPKFGEPAEKQLTPSHLVRRSQHIVDIAHLAAQDLTGMEKLLVQSGVEENKAHELLFEAIKREVNRKRSHRHEINRDNKIAQRFNSWGLNRRVDFMTKLLAKVDPSVQQSVVDLTRDRLYETIVTEDGSEISTHTRGLLKSLAQSYEERRVVQEGRYRATIIEVKRKARWLGDTVVLPNSLKELHPAAVLSPIIAWEKSKDGSRKLLLPHAQSKGSEIQPNHYIDGVLGAMVLAYTSPEVRRTWPSKMSIRGSREQPLGAAQVPVLALMRRAQLLTTPLIETAEQIAA